MYSIQIALIAFASIFGGALLGMFIRSLLPDHHMREDTRDVVKLGTGLMATLAALVLGLLVSSAKGTLDAMNTELTQESAKVIMLDRVLADYGPETKDIRELLRGSVVNVIRLIWPEDKASPVNLRSVEASRSAAIIQAELRGLSPVNNSQRQLQAQALQVAADLAQTRWVMIVQTQQALPTVLLFVLLFWLIMLFAGFGLLSRGNATVITVLFVCALSVSGAIFLILDMNTPFAGMLKISSTPLHRALDLLGR
jgi:hypothetical protein